MDSEIKYFNSDFLNNPKRYLETGGADKNKEAMEAIALVPMSFQKRCIMPVHITRHDVWPLENRRTILFYDTWRGLFRPFNNSFCRFVCGQKNGNQIKIREKIMPA